MREGRASIVLEGSASALLCRNTWQELLRVCQGLQELPHVPPVTMNAMQETRASRPMAQSSTKGFCSGRTLDHWHAFSPLGVDLVETQQDSAVVGEGAFPPSLHVPWSQSGEAIGDSSVGLEATHGWLLRPVGRGVLVELRDLSKLLRRLSPEQLAHHFGMLLLP